MGIRVNLFMECMERHLNSIPLKVFIWLHYIDDILIWTHGQESLELFLQNFYCTFSIKFTWTSSSEHTTWLYVDV